MSRPSTENASGWRSPLKVKRCVSEPALPSNTTRLVDARPCGVQLNSPPNASFKIGRFCRVACRCSSSRSPRCRADRVNAMSAKSPSRSFSTSDRTVASPHSTRCSPQIQTSPGRLIGSPGGLGSDVRISATRGSSGSNLPNSSSPNPVSPRSKPIPFRSPSATGKQLGVPSGTQRQLVVGDGVGALLRLRPAAGDHDLDIGDAEALRRAHTTVARDDRAGVVDQHRHRPSLFADWFWLIEMQVLAQRQLLHYRRSRPRPARGIVSRCWWRRPPSRARCGCASASMTAWWRAKSTTSQIPTAATRNFICVTRKAEHAPPPLDDQSAHRSAEDDRLGAATTRTYRYRVHVPRLRNVLRYS